MGPLKVVPRKLLSVKRHYGSLLEPVSSHNRSRLRASEAVETTPLRKAALQIYNKALESVGPKTLVNNFLKVDRNKSILWVQDKEIRLSKNVYVIAFGQAVTGMIRGLEDLIGEHIVKSIASLPDDTLALLRNSGRENLLPRLSCELYESAENNVPDERSHTAAKRVVDVVEKLNSDHLLVTILSGGCSALLTMPKSPVTINDEAKLNLLLRQVGASMRDKNIIRKNISMLKGGGLARIAHPAKALTLILSNLSHSDSYDLGGGPTSSDWSTPNQALDMIRKYGLSDKVPHSVIELLSKDAIDHSEGMMSSQQWLHGAISYDKNGSVDRRPPPRYDCSHVHNVIVGSNHIAVETIETECLRHGIVPVILDSANMMDAERAGTMLANIAHFVSEVVGKASRVSFDLPLVIAEVHCIKSGATKDQMRKIAAAAEQAAVTRQACCIIFAGELTTQVQGSGQGGPCQHLALSAAIALRNLVKLHKSLQNCDVQLLSVDSDGLDGGTEAAGAIADCYQANESIGEKMADDFLRDFDSYGFYSAIPHKQHSVFTGLTGTDVMSFQLLFIGKK